MEWLECHHQYWNESIKLTEDGEKQGAWYVAVPWILSGATATEQQYPQFVYNLNVFT